MAKYIKQEMADLRGDGQQGSYYRMKVERNIGTREFIRHMTHPGAGLSESMAIHVIDALGEQLARELAEGYSVTIDGLGTFTATVGLDWKRRETDGGGEAKRDARCLTVDGVRYKADKELVKEVSMRCDLRKGGESRVRCSPYSREERMRLVVDYLASAAHPVMRLSDYVGLTGVSRTTASRELREMSRGADAPIMPVGRGAALVYVRRAMDMEEA